MARYRVIWEERKYTIVEANSKEEAEERVMNGEFARDFSEELTTMPEAFEEE